MTSADALVDHAWIDNGQGVLSCAAGNRHSPVTAVVCPYYLRTDVVALLGIPFTQGKSSLRWRGDRYVKITRLCAPTDWASLIAALPIGHGLRPMAWSLLTGLDTARWMLVIDPRDALRAALREADGPIVAQLAQLCAALGDPGNAAGMLGLTGSAALDPSRLDLADRGQVSDVDLTVYPGVEPDQLRAAIATIGGNLPAELPDSHLRGIAYQRSRIMPPTTDEYSQAVFWTRRCDLAWLDALRLDLTRSQPTGIQVPVPAYMRPAVRGWSSVVTVRAVHDGYPVAVHVDHSDLERVLITARGYETTLRPGDRLSLRGLLHRPADQPAFVSIDDAAGHHISLIQQGESS